MKISDVNLSLRDLPMQPVAERQPVEAMAKSFRRELTDLNDERYRLHIEDLVLRIQEQGELVAKRADIKELHKYREMITQLLNETVSNSFVFTKNSAFDSRGRHRIYTMIKRVHGNLDDLTQELLKDEADHLALLDSVDDIRGLLVDLYF